MHALTAASVLRDIAYENRLCQACGATIAFWFMNASDIVALRVQAICHGATATTVVFLDGANLKPSISAFGDWVSRLFESDANPDLRELICYNRGWLPGGRRLAE